MNDRLRQFLVAEILGFSKVIDYLEQDKPDAELTAKMAELSAMRDTMQQWLDAE